MMRAFVFALAAIACACAPAQQAERCHLDASSEVAFTRPDAADVVSAHSLGAACDQAIGVLTVATADGHPIWSWTAPLARAFGEDFHAADEEHVQSFLDRWAQPSIASTAAAPEWSALGESARTTLDRATYDDIRARDLPMLCHLSGVARETCVFWEPAAAGAGLFLERDVAASE